MIKKIGLASVLVVVVFVTVLFAQTWVTSNQSTVGWDAITYSIDPGERVVYRTYLSNSKTDPGKTNPALIGDTTELQYTFTFTEKGSYFIGIKSVVQVESTVGAGDWEDVTESVIAWSDDPQYAQAGETFGIRFYPVPPVPAGIHPVTP